MRKNSCLILLLMLGLALSGCGNEESVRGDIAVEEEAEISESEEASSVEEEASSVEEEVASVEEEVASVEEEAELSLGVSNGNVYESEFIGIGYHLDEGWSFYNDEQIRELNNATADLAGEEYQELMSNAEVVYDMFAIDADGLNNVNVNLEKKNPVQILAMDLSEVYENTMTVLGSTYENMGGTNFAYEVSNVDVAGEELVAAYVSVDINEVPVYQILFMKKCNGYLANVSVTTYFEDTTAQLLENFYWLD